MVIFTRPFATGGGKIPHLLGPWRTKKQLMMLIPRAFIYSTPHSARQELGKKTLIEARYEIGPASPPTRAHFSLDLLYVLQVVYNLAQVRELFISQLLRVGKDPAAPMPTWSTEARRRRERERERKG